MARGNKKAATQKKLDRSMVLPFYLSPEQIALYERDDYKYLIHLLRTQPEDPYGILQYLLLKFHPLIITSASKYRTALTLEWPELVAFSRSAFVELIYRFELSSTLYFRLYMRIALRRAIYDYVLYESRRKSLMRAESLDAYEVHQQDAVMSQAAELAAAEEPTFFTESFCDEVKTAVREFVRNSPEVSTMESEAFIGHYFDGMDIPQLATRLQCSRATTQAALQSCLALVRMFVVREGFVCR